MFSTYNQAPKRNFPRKNKLPLRMEMDCKDTSIVIDYKNIKIGKQADSLFELPAGYKKFSLGGSVSGILKGMAGGGEE